MEFATGALGTLLPKLGQLLLDEYNLHKGTKKNIEFLSRELESMRAALCSVGEVPPEDLKEQVRIWARDVRELSYDLEDILDTFLVRVQGPEPPSKNSAKRFIKKMMRIVTKATTRHKIGQEIMDIKERVKEVAERRDRYKVDAITPPKTMVDPRITSLYTDAASLVGIDESREELVTRLTKGASPKKIVSIVGFGGLGKTTLAKAVYDKLRLQFDCTAFVPVGRNPDLKKVLKDILIDHHKQGYMHFNLDILDERQLIDKLRELLEEKRYFIVIDDVWEVQTWETIKLALVESNSGSRTIITTRNHEVAKEAGEVYELKPLSDDNSRKLFFARIFGVESKSSVHQPDDISDKILRRCGGIPLAIITMASMLVGKPREEWSEVHSSIGYSSKGNRQVENTMKILVFSYYDLPPHLRTCLLYLSVFSEDSFIEKGPLIWMWVAEGFVQEKQGNSSFETAEGYFNELVNRSMIQLVEEWEWPDMVVWGCQVHDMVLDLIRSISSVENFVTVLQDKNSEGSSSITITTQAKVRRFALQNINRPVEANMDMQQVRSFVSCECDIGKVVVPFISSLRLVRVLYIDFSDWRTARAYREHYWILAIGQVPLMKLLHLRYLRLCRGVEHPVGIETLKFLQTLDVHQPLRSMGSLTQLLCLRIRGLTRRVPDEIGKLTSLQELDIVYMDEEEEPLRRFVKALGGLTELRVLRLGMLRMMPYGRGILMDMVESLRNLHRLEYLSLPRRFSSSVYADTAALEAWGFLLPRTIQQLFLEWTRFSRVPWFCVNRSRLPYLSHLYLLVEYFDEQDMRILGGLPQLRHLRVRADSTKEVVCNTTVDGAAGDDCFLFPKLRRCSLGYTKVWFLPKDDTGRFCMQCVHASMLVGSERKEVWSDGTVGVAPTLMPSVQRLEFIVPAQDLIKVGVNLVLRYFTCLQNVSVRIICKDGTTAAIEEEAAAALRHAADVHPKRPTLHIIMERIHPAHQVSPPFVLIA